MANGALKKWENLKMAMSSRRKVLAAGLVMLLAGSLVGTEATAQSGTIRTAQSVDVLTLDPSKNTAAFALNVYQNVFGTLAVINRDGSVGADVAESWKAEKDNTVWTFKIRPGMKFHNGDPVTVDDIVWTYEKILGEAKSPVRSYIKAVAAVEKVGSDSVRITTKTPFATFNRTVSLVSILPRKAYTDLGEKKFALKSIGSGPFKITEWVKDSHLNLEANTAYWGGSPKVKSLVFRPMPSEAARAAALSTGEIDVVPVLPPPLVDSLSKQRGVKVVKVVSNRVIYIAYNQNTKPLDNVKLRRAILHAVDREAITTNLLRGLGVPIGQLSPPVMFGHDPSIGVPKFDPEMSRRLVKESGYDGSQILFQYPNNRWAFADQTSQAIVGYLGDVGINLKLQSMEMAALFPLWLSNKLPEMYLFSLGISIMDADLLLNLNYESETMHAYWSTPEVDRLAKEQRATTDPAKRKDLISKIWQIDRENAIYAPLYNEIHAYGIRDCVDWTPRPDERTLYKDATSTCS
jgi:peptide/nickel transport system substrate-binding protein